MEVKSRSSSTSANVDHDEDELRRGPWTNDEDFKLINYISIHGEGRWNSLANSSGLKRTGKSCRLRWLNYLKPDLRRGNITLEEQLLILQLHSRWGNRWSKIAQYLPGRTDNEIKNYWRTRVQKHAKQLNCDVNSKQFKDTIRYIWMPRLAERIQAATAAAATVTATSASTSDAGMGKTLLSRDVIDNDLITSSYTPDSASSTTAASSDSIGTRISPVSDSIDYYSSNISVDYYNNPNPDYFQDSQVGYSEFLMSDQSSYYNNIGDGLNFGSLELKNHWLDSGDASANFLSAEDFSFLQQQFNFNM